MKHKKVFLITCAGMAAAGLALSCFSFFVGARPGFYIDSSGVHSPYAGKDDTGLYKLEKTKLDPFSSFSIELDYADLEIIPSDGYYLEYQLSSQSREEPKAEVKDGRLTFQESPQGGSIQFFADPFSFGDPENGCYVKLYVPEDMDFEEISVRSASGNVELEDLKAEKGSIFMDYGDLTGNRLEGEELELELDSGDMSFSSVTASSSLSIYAGYGELTAESLSCKTGKIQQEYGGLEAGTVEADDLSVESDYGDADIEKLEAGKAEITLDSGTLKIQEASVKDGSFASDYGDVLISKLKNFDDYSLKLATEYGDIKTAKGNPQEETSGDSHYEKAGKKENTLTVYCEAGDIKIGK